MPPPSSMPRLTPGISMFFFFSRRCKCRDIYCTHNCPRSDSNRRRPLFSIKHREREKVNYVWQCVCYQYIADSHTFARHWEKESIYARQNVSMAKPVSLINYKRKHNRPFFCCHTRMRREISSIDTSLKSIKLTWNVILCRSLRHEFALEEEQKTQTNNTLTRHTWQPLFCTFVLCPS